MNPMLLRVLKAGLMAMAAAFAGGFAACAALLFAVRNSPDGQAGMGIIVVWPLAALVAGVATFTISMVRSGRG